MSWKERIEQAAERGHFTREDKRVAVSWQTCAVGEALHARGRGCYAGSLAMYPLGMDFMHAVHGDNMRRAASVVAALDWLATSAFGPIPGAPAVVPDLCPIFEVLERKRARRRALKSVACLLAMVVLL